MLRSYSNGVKKHFTFGYSSNNSITNQDSRILNHIETELNNLVSNIKLFLPNNNLHLDLVINNHISLVVKNILIQYDIVYVELQKWCGLRKYTVIKFDKIIPRIIARPLRDNSTPLDQIVSNAINIPNTSIRRKKYPIAMENTSRNHYLIPENKNT
jgi:hypothetical protein